MGFMMSLFNQESGRYCSIFLQDSPLCPHLIQVAAAHGVRLALLNGRLSGEEVLRWHSYKTCRALLSLVISKFELIIPSSDQVG
jgi:3-deoxy-D-manno-octulosonic-acid transferase